MSSQVVTEVSASVLGDREAELVAAFNALPESDFPDGLLRSYLLRGQEGRWRIQTVWRDREALDAMIAVGETPVARRLFQQVGASPTLEILEVEGEQRPRSVGG